MNEKKQSSSAKTLADKHNKKVNPDVLKWIIIGLLCFVVVVLVFSAGMFVGGRKARFSYRWAESYHRNFAGPKAGFFDNWRKFPMGDFIEGHGAFGEIIKLDDSSFVIRGRGDMEKVIIITENTIIEKGREMVKKEDLRVGDWVVIIGSPNEDGQIEARLIRLFNEGMKLSFMDFYD